MSRVRVVAAVLAVPALLLMAQATSALAWSPLVVAGGCDNGSPTVTVTGKDLGQFYPPPASGARKTYTVPVEVLDNPGVDNHVVATLTGHWTSPGPDSQALFSGNPGLAPGNYVVRIKGHDDSTSGWFTVGSCSKPTPTPTPTPTGTPGFPPPSVAVACTDSAKADLSLTVTDNGSYVAAGKGVVQVYTPSGDRLDDIPWSWDAKGAKTQTIATIEITGQNATINGTWKLVIDGRPEAAVNVSVSCGNPSGGGSGSGAPGLPDTGLGA